MGTKGKKRKVKFRSFFRSFKIVLFLVLLPLPPSSSSSLQVEEEEEAGSDSEASAGSLPPMSSIRDS